MLEKNLEISINFACPKCGSSNIRRKFYVPISKYGYLPKPPVDFCDDCEFKSEESFCSINFRNERDYKIEQILQNGIQ
jgi:hypothetical protein